MATYTAGKIACEDPAITDMLRTGVELLLAQYGAPASDDERTTFVERLCLGDRE